MVEGERVAPGAFRRRVSSRLTAAPLNVCWFHCLVHALLSALLQLLGGCENVFASGAGHNASMARDEHGHPVIPHEVVGGEDCHGCLIIQVRGDHADIVCNACDVFIRSAPTTEVDAILTSMARGAICSHRCPHCQALNTFPGFSAPHRLYLS